MYYHLTLQLCTFVIYLLLFHIEIEGKCGWIIRVWGGRERCKGYVACPSVHPPLKWHVDPPLKLFPGGGGCSGPAPPRHPPPHPLLLRLCVSVILKLPAFAQVFTAFSPGIECFGYTYYANSADPFQTPQNAASEQGQHGLLTGISMQNTIKDESGHREPLKLEMDLSK